MTEAGAALAVRPGRVIAVALAVVLGVLASGVLIWRGTSAVFTATTTNAANSWTLGSVTLTDDDSGTALFTAAGLTPGDTGSSCITVTYNGDVATTVRLYVSAAVDVDAIAQFVDLTVQEGSGGGFGSCAGFSASATIYAGTLSAFAATHAGYAGGVGGWAPSAAGSVRVYRFSYTLNAATPSNRQGKSTSTTLQWEAQA